MGRLGENKVTRPVQGGEACIPLGCVGEIFLVAGAGMECKRMARRRYGRSGACSAIDHFSGGDDRGMRYRSLATITVSPWISQMPRERGCRGMGAEASLEAVV